MSNVIIVGQPYVLQLDTGVSLLSATAPKILYRKPDQTTGEIAATVSGQVLSASVTGALNDLNGDWRFHASVQFPGDDAPTSGDVANLTVKPKFYKK